MGALACLPKVVRFEHGDSICRSACVEVGVSQGLCIPCEEMVCKTIRVQVLENLAGQDADKASSQAVCVWHVRSVCPLSYPLIQQASYRQSGEDTELLATK